MQLAPSYRVASARVYFAAAALVVAALSGCQCRTGGTGKSYGEIAVVWTDTDGTTKENADATFDFGTAYSGDKIPMQLVVKNLGNGPLTLTTLDLADGDKVSIGPDAQNASGFEVDFHGATISPGENTAFTMFFTPHSGRAYLSHLTLTATGVAPNDAPASITLKGNGQGGSCDFPDVIDFGLVPVGETFPDFITLRQPGGHQRGRHHRRPAGRRRAQLQRQPAGRGGDSRHVVGHGDVQLHPHREARLHRHRRGEGERRLPLEDGDAEGHRLRRGALVEPV